MRVDVEKVEKKNKKVKETKEDSLNCICNCNIL